MNFLSFLSIRTSIGVSLVSGAGFITLLFVAPMENPVLQEVPNLIEEKRLIRNPYLEAEKKKSQGQFPETETRFEFSISPKKVSKWYKEELDSFYAITSFSENPFPKNPFDSFRYSVPEQGSKNIQVFDPQTGMRFLAVLNRMDVMATNAFYFGNTLTPQRLQAAEFQFPVAGNLTAIFRSNSTDYFEDNRSLGRTYSNIAWTGVDLSQGKYVSTRFLAGESITQVYNPYLLQAGYTAQAPNARFQDQQFRETEAGLRQYEWQTYLRPTNSVQIEGTLLQSRRDLNQSISQPDGTRVGIDLGGRLVKLNMRYTYQNLIPNRAFMQGNPVDTASLGVSMNLDAAQKYSVFVGQNFHNLATYRPTDTVAPTNGFIATFRGKTSSSNTSSSSFFLNVKNGYFRDQGLGLIGANPQQARNFGFFEYATSLGMKYSF